ncbi:MAG: hypothetical protein E7335_06695 [Clostridiales bacterium]|nr:hypothetical protein [Clostridiales bacterium]
MQPLKSKVAPLAWPRKSGLGNHRILIYTAHADKYVRVTIPWRRRDLHPETIGMRMLHTPAGSQIQNGMGCAEIRNIRIESITRFEGVIVFEAPETGIYELYYMPHTLSGPGYCPNTDYMRPDEMTPDADWLACAEKAAVQTASAIFYESRTEFDSFYPMEQPMTHHEAKAFLDNDAPFAIVTESRLHPLRMQYEMPAVWLERSKEHCCILRDTVCKNEHYTFQLAVCAKEPLQNIHVDFYDANGYPLSKEKCICFNLTGRDIDGNPVVFQRNAAANEVLPLWCGVAMEHFSSQTTEIQLTAKVYAENTDYTAEASILLSVNDTLLPANGDDDLWRLSRLFWLNSDIGISDDVIAPYFPIENAQDDLSLEITGKRITVSALGLPAQIESYYNDEGQINPSAEPVQLLDSPIALQVKKTGGAFAIQETDEQERIIKGTNCTQIRSAAVQNDVEIESIVEYEADGHIDTHIRVTALEDGEYSFTLQIPMKSSAAQHMMGMCYEGGRVPAWWEYDWDERLFGSLVWFGGVRGGLQIKLMQETEHWGSIKPLPKMWYNNGLGKMTVRSQPYKGLVLFEGTTGKMQLKAGQTEMLHFHMMVTPLHPINTDRHWKEHIYHIGPWVGNGVPNIELAKSLGATMINLHQGGPLNENINYPFFVAPRLKEQVDKAHELGMRYKVYYTVRELSNYATEFWALRALREEIFAQDPNSVAIADTFASEENRFQANTSAKKAGGAWLREHLVEGYVPAWHEELETGEMDCAIATCGVSRWHNYYLCGLNWLIRNVGIDGLYLDGIGYDRRIMKRLRRVLNASGKKCDIDIHSGNEHCEIQYGYEAPANKYLEHFAYADALWLGECYMYEDVSPDYYLVESSGLPFGLMGEMLHGGGNPWRGMVYGMTARLGWEANVISREIWELWDSFDIANARMLGYWHEECPVTVEDDQLRATCYINQKGEILVVIASWYPQDRKFLIRVNAQQLGLSGEYEFYAPAIRNVQEEAVFNPHDLIPIEKNKGWFFMIRPVQK